MRKKLAPLPRFLYTARLAKYRLFRFAEHPTLPDCQLIAFPFADDYTFGLLHSRPHELWALRQGSRQEDRPRYTNTTCFDTFPFPGPTDAHRAAVAGAAARLDELRRGWLDPPEWTRRETLTFPGSVDGPWAHLVTDPDGRGVGTVRYERTVPRDPAAAAKLAGRTLTNFYNDRPAWLADAHSTLDAAVLEAYGLPRDIGDRDLLRALLDRNLAA